MAHLPRHHELTVAANSTMMSDQMLVCFKREVSEDLEAEGEFRWLCQQVNDRISHRKKLIDELESLHGSISAV
ncbi:hypothetical protein CTI12_AA356150 [Artemisia annua]|uniref:Uncharacterized protein n=1 Tax=Artemisia annua TaxID=35608 RepID=A0A2U1MGG7_ARTAN|nr:hypothetical protein CTI12_AA356150 [Artemisia annua]